MMNDISDGQVKVTREGAALKDPESVPSVRKIRLRSKLPVPERKGSAGTDFLIGFEAVGLDQLRWIQDCQRILSHMDADILARDNGRHW